MTQQKLYLSASPAETERIAAEIAADVKRGDYIALFGEMGAGKTAFTRGLVGALVPECLPLVHSPTFAIVNEYRGADNTVYHFDLYRRQDEDDLYSTGFFDCIGGDCVVVSEWSELFPDVLPKDAKRVTIERLHGEGESARCIRYEYEGEENV